MTNAKIVATLGPSSQDEITLEKMILAGMNVARLNFSHGVHEDHLRMIKMIRSVSSKMNTPITILQDLQGPKMRIGWMPEKGVILETGHLVTIQTDPKDDQQGNDTHIPVEIPQLTESLSSGNRILMDDGNLELEVLSVNGSDIVTRVVLGGVLTSHKGINLPGAELAISGFTDKDRQDLVFGLHNKVDAVAISFVCSARDVELVRQTIREEAPKQTDTLIIAKLERPEAINNLDEILAVSDGVMVARGDLAVETSPAAVPIIQKKIISSANRMGKIVITATQMLESMIHNPRPTRAESSDVANAIFDGTDAVMLSAESASGAYPVESIAMMRTIIEQAESHFEEWGHCDDCANDYPTDDAISMTRAACELAHDRNVACIAVFSRTGRTGVLMSKARPRVPIIAFTPHERTYLRMGILWGVRPFLVPTSYTIESMIKSVENALITTKSIQPKEQVVIISGYPLDQLSPPNFAFLHTVG